MNGEDEHKQNKPWSRDVGVKLRYARLLQGLRLSDVAKAVGCTESLISKVENGRANPSLNMLHKIAGAVGTNIAVLFSEDIESARVVLRQGERPIIPNDQLRTKDGITLERLVPALPGRLLQGNLHIVEPGGQSEGAIVHVGEEVGFIVEGTIELTVDGRRYILNTGDSFFFNSALSHSYRNMGETRAKTVWINSPPTY